MSVAIDGSKLSWRMPYLTAGVPGIGGMIRAAEEDFVVEEVPAYAPCGEGEHTFFGVEKRGISTLAVMRQIAVQLGIDERTMGSAGLKDAHAIARQTLSVPMIPPETLLALQLEKAQVLWAQRHTNKLRTGHLRGNQFVIRIRNVMPDALERGEMILAELLTRGVPNGYGPQRFGNHGDNHEIGLMLLRNDREGLRVRGARHLPFRVYQLCISALQSALFNMYVSRRILSGTMDSVLEGDVARKETTGGIFTVEDPLVDQPRAQAWEISATGPIYGYKLMEAQQTAGALERQVIEDAGLKLDDFRSVKAKGSRRPIRYAPQGLTWVWEAPDVLVVSFFAPKGAFATMLLRELMKDDSIGGWEDDSLDD